MEEVKERLAVPIIRRMTKIDEQLSSCKRWLNTVCFIPSDYDERAAPELLTLLDRLEVNTASTEEAAHQVARSINAMYREDLQEMGLEDHRS